MTAEIESPGALATAAPAASELQGEPGKTAAAERSAAAAPAPEAAVVTGALSAPRALSAPAVPPAADAHSATGALPLAESETAAAPLHDHSKCANCGTALIGNYCHSCGQSGHVHRSLLHIGEELLHGILHFDTRSWRTLPLLVGRPGLLTRRYIEGQRVRYVSPLALFLFSVFLMFFVYSFTGGSSVNTPADPRKTEEAREQIAKAVDEARQNVAEATKDVAAAATPEEKNLATVRLTAARNELQAQTVALNAIASATAAKRATENAEEATQPSTETKRAINAKIDTDYPNASRILKHAVDNPELTFYKIKSASYKFAFLLVPISLPFLWLLFFWHRKVKVYDHAIFMLYSLSFMSLWFSFMAVLSFSSYTAWLIAPAVFYIPVHIFLQVKETYRLSGWGATWRTLALMGAGAFIFLMFAAAILAISLR